MVDSKFTEYAEDVLSGRIIAGELVRLCCQRFMDWFNRDDLYFDEEAAERPVKFISHLKHVRGDFVGQRFILQDWQKFLVYNVFGWKNKYTKKRQIHTAYIQISRKCGKTSLAAALGLYGLIADNEAGSEVLTVAPSRTQSGIAFKCATEYLETINKHNLFNYNRNEIRFPKRHAKFQILSSDSKFGDGFNTHIGIVDEYHAFSNNDIPELIESGMAMRSQPLMIMITTAGFDLLSPCKQYRDMCDDILHKLKTDDTIFPLIYELDEDDDIEDRTVWKKCCPSLGLTVGIDHMESRLLKMKNSPSDEVAILTKTFNKWCSSADSWLPNSLLVENSEKIDLNMFKDDPNLFTILGIDLASVSDLTSVAMCFNYNDKFYFKSWYFLPEIALDESPNKTLYHNWRRTGELIVTPGNATDYTYVLSKILEINKIIPVFKVEYDTWNASQFTEMAVQERVKMDPFSQSLGNFNRPTKEFERLLRLGKIVIDDNEITRWCFGNCTIKTDWNDNVKPVKGNSKYGKIDGVIAILQSLGGMLYTPSLKHFFTVV